MNLKNKRVFITGASGDIGKAILELIRKENSNISIQSHKNDLKAKTNELMIKSDFTIKDQIETMINQVKNHLGNIDVYINTVGVEVADKDQLDTSKWKDLFDINLFGAIECTRHILPLLSDNGVIVHITALSGIPGIVFESSLAYSVAKAGLIKFTENLALMLAPHKRAFCVTPGYTITRMWDNFTPKQKSECVDLMPIKRFIQPAEVAQFTIDLIKNDAITGGNFVIDGGLHLKTLI